MARIVVVRPAVVVHQQAGELGGQHVGHLGQVQGGAVAAVAVVAGGCPCAEVEFTSRLGGGDVQGAAGAVAAEQGALGAAQHFHALDVDDVEDAANGLAHVHAVDIDAHLGVHHQGGFTAAHAANEDGGVGIGRRLLVEDGVGRHGADVGHVEDADVLNGVAAEGRDGDRRFLQQSLPPLGGHQNFLQQAAGPVVDLNLNLVCDQLPFRFSLSWG